jgi:hypothetical protein
VQGSCECGNEPLGSIKCWETIEWQHNFWPLEWFSAPQSLVSFWYVTKIQLRYLLINAAFALFLRKRNFLSASLTSSSMSHNLTL